MKTRLLILWLLLVSLAAAQPDQTSKRISLSPCEVDAASGNGKEKALCGSYEVYEDRSAKAGRKIPIKIVVFPSTSPAKEPDPLFYIPGGPGSSATEDAPYIAQDLARIREHRDLIFVDQRGTGGSNLLFCDFFDPKNIQSYLVHWNPPEKVRECRKLLEQKADLKLYGTSIAMDDLDEVREALGYGKINLTGGSYGTRAVMAYVKQHGANVRSVMLHGVSPFDQFMPGEFPWHTQRALDGVLDECMADLPCASAFPKIREEMRSVLARLQKGPVEVDVVVDKQPATVKLSRDLAAEAVRYMLYQSGSAGRIPLVLHEASQGNFKPLAEAAIFYRKVIVATGATGMYLSVTCAEDLPFAKRGMEADAESTFLGSYRLKQQLEACAEWPRGRVPDDYSKLVNSNVPALILSGQRDPVTPPEYGDRVARHLPNSLHIVVPSGGHGFGGLDGLGCISRLTDQFIESGSAKALDTACVKAIKRKGFELKLE